MDLNGGGSSQDGDPLRPKVSSFTKTLVEVQQSSIALINRERLSREGVTVNREDHNRIEQQSFTRDVSASKDPARGESAGAWSPRKPSRRAFLKGFSAA